MAHVEMAGDRGGTYMHGTQAAARERIELLLGVVNETVSATAQPWRINTDDV